MALNLLRTSVWKSCQRFTKLTSNRVFSHMSKSKIQFQNSINNRSHLQASYALFHSSGKYNGIVEDNKTKSVTVWENVRNVPSSPAPALILGLSGLIPFVATPAYMTMAGLYCPQLAMAQLAYGACILSFLGGVRWGFVLPPENPVQVDWINLGYSVLPSLLAWISLLINAKLGCITVMTGLTLTAYCDMAMYGYPVWFKGLRFILSFVAVISLWTVFMCSFLLSSESTDQKKEENQNQSDDSNN